MSRERPNPCAASGCNGACCGNVIFRHMTDAALQILAPEGTNVRKADMEDYEELRDMLASRRRRPRKDGPPTTIFYIPLGDGINKVLLNGTCPNLQPDGGCGIYDKRPMECRTFNIGSDDCTKARDTENLGPAFVLIPEIPKRKPIERKRRPGLKK